MTGAQAVQQVLTRVLERNNSPISQLAAGTGPADVTITTSAQLLTFLNEGKDILCRTPLLELRGTATIAVVEGTARYTLQGATTSPTNRTLWSVRSAKLTASANAAVFHPRPAASKFHAIYYPDGTETGVPQYVFDAGSQIILGPIPSAAGAGSLVLSGLLLGKAITSGDQIEDVPDALLPHLFAFGCWRLCQQNATNERFAAVLPFWAGEIAPWAGPFVGIGA